MPSPLAPAPIFKNSLEYFRNWVNPKQGSSTSNSMDTKVGILIGNGKVFILSANLGKN
jgi:hypothetical protein